MTEITIDCPHCDQHLEAPAEMAGETVECPSCNQSMVIAEPETTSASPTPPEPTASSSPETKACPYCGETILLVAKKCKHCGEFVDESLRAESTPTSQGQPVDAVIKQIHDYEKLSCIFWGVLGVLQCLSGFAIVAGIWNIVAVFQGKKLLPRILARDKEIPSLYEPIWPIVGIGLVNLFLGGIIGVGFAVFDYIIRGKVLANAALFNGADESPPRSDPNIITLSIPYAEAFSIFEDALVRCKGTIKKRDADKGVLEAAWKYGVNAFGLRVTGMFQSVGDDRIQVTIRGRFKDAFDTLGAAKKKAMAVREAFLMLVGGDGPARRVTGEVGLFLCSDSSIRKHNEGDKTMADISIDCPHCDQHLEAPAEMAGETVECPSCGGSIVLHLPSEPLTQPKKRIVVHKKPTSRPRPPTIKSNERNPSLFVKCVLVVVLALIGFGGYVLFDLYTGRNNATESNKGNSTRSRRVSKGHWEQLVEEKLLSCEAAYGYMSDTDKIGGGYESRQTSSMRQLAESLRAAMKLAKTEDDFRQIYESASESGDEGKVAGTDSRSIVKSQPTGSSVLTRSVPSKTVAQHTPVSSIPQTGHTPQVVESTGLKRVRLTVPSGWQAVDDDNSVLRLQHSITDSGDLYDERIVIYGPFPISASLSQEAQALTDILKAQGFTLVKQERLQTGNSESEYLVFDHDDEEGRLLRSMRCLMLDGRHSWMICGFALREEFMDWDTTFRDIMPTFTVLR